MNWLKKILWRWTQEGREMYEFEGDNGKVRLSRSRLIPQDECDAVSDHAPDASMCAAKRSSCCQRSMDPSGFCAHLPRVVSATSNREACVYSKRSVMVTEPAWARS